MSPNVMRSAAALLTTAMLAGTPLAAEPSLVAGQWSIVEMGGKRMRAPATINFTRVRWLGLNTPCGPLWGWYRRSDTTLRIHVTGTTRFQYSSGSPCHGIDYRVQLGRVRSYSVEADSLVLLNQEGKAIARLERTR